MNKPRFGIGLVHGVVATRSGARLSPIADAFDVAEIIGTTTRPHVLLISTVPPQLQDDVAANRLLADPARVSSLAMAHHRVLQAVAAVTDVVPIRLATLVSGPAGARELLIREAARFADGLAAIRNAVEFAVRIVPARQPIVPPARPMQAASGRDYLRARSDQRARSRPAAAEIALREFARQAVAIRDRAPGMRPAAVAEAAFLVDRRKLAAFAECAGRIERQFADHGLSLDVFGPLPAYSFVDGRKEVQP